MRVFSKSPSSPCRKKTPCVAGIAGVPANVGVGDIVKGQGTNEKKHKGSPNSEQFVVDGMTGDTCRCRLSPLPDTAHTPN
jgi:hypothetical protein